jgi:hypothetical protein
MSLVWCMVHSTRTRLYISSTSHCGLFPWSFLHLYLSKKCSWSMSLAGCGLWIICSDWSSLNRRGTVGSGFPTACVSPSFYPGLYVSTMSLCHKQRCAFLPFPSFFVGATAIASHIMNSAFHTQPSSHTFDWWLNLQPLNVSTGLQTSTSVVHTFHELIAFMEQASSRTPWLKAFFLTLYTL